jgi:hypothetical protein
MSAFADKIAGVIQYGGRLQTCQDIISLKGKPYLVQLKSLVESL